MASTAQVLANRANAQLSTGPKSPEGKAAVSQNATRHGLAAATFALLPNEDPAEFASLAEVLNTEFRPGTEHERFLVDQAAKARWRIRRIERLEAEAFDRILTEPGTPNGSPDSLILDTLEQRGNILDKLQRYAAAAERAYSKAVRDLLAARTDRLQNEAKSADIDLKRYLTVRPPLPAASETILQNKPNRGPVAPPNPALRT